MNEVEARGTGHETRSDDDRIRFWSRVAAAGETRPRFLRVVTLEDGETVHNAFFDRNFREE